MVDSVVVNSIRYDIIASYIEGYMAMVDHQKCTIANNPNNHPQLFYSDILHEVVHIILQHCGFIDHHPKHEKYVVALGYGLYDFLKNNPEFVKALLESKGEES